MSYVAEQHVIGSLLINSDSIADIYNVLEPEMFTSDVLGKMYHEFQKGYDNRYEVNAMTLVQKLTDEGYPDSVVGQEIQECIRITFTTATIISDSQVILREFRAKKLSKRLSSIKVTPTDLDANLRELSNVLMELTENKKSSASTLADITKQYQCEYFKEKDKIPLMLGFPKLDNLLGGLEGGDMIVIGARPAVGKSALVTQITSNLAKNGKRIGFYNLEMQKKQVYERFVVSESGIPLTRLRRAIKFIGDEKEKFENANKKFAKADNIVIISDGSKTVNEIRAESKHMDYDIIIIDYLQLLKANTTYRGNRTAEVGEISREIKNLAMELNIPIIALSQLNRVSEMRDVKEPTMSELREAGNIEQDASVIILLWNLDNNDKAKKGCKIEKNRQGESGKVVLKFNGEIMRFEETDEDIKTVSEFKRVDDDCPFN